MHSRICSSPLLPICIGQQLILLFGIKQLIIGGWTREATKLLKGCERCSIEGSRAEAYCHRSTLWSYRFIYKRRNSFVSDAVEVCCPEGSRL